MRRFLLVTVCIFGVSGVLAAQQEIKPLSISSWGIPESKGTLNLSSIRAPEEVSGCDDDVILGEWVYPVIARVQGLNGAFFKTDLSIANFRNANQRYSLQYIPQGASGLGGSPEILTINANTISSISDILSPSNLNESGLGFIFAQALQPSTGVDTAAVLEGSARIYYPYSGSQGGTVGFQYRAMRPMRLPDTTVATMFGLLQSPDFRTNATLVNLDDQPHTWSITAVGAGVSPLTFTETIPAFGMQQFAIPTSFAPAGNNYFVLQARLQTTFGLTYPWTFSGASVDNHTGDTFWVTAKYAF